jgi:hypothetical protein
VEGSGDMAPIIPNASYCIYDYQCGCYFDMQHADQKVGSFFKLTN